MQEQQLVSVALDDLLQLLELANRLVLLNSVSLTERNFVKNTSQNVFNALEAAKKQATEQNDKVDETA